jgi:hypothetical protein
MSEEEDDSSGDDTGDKQPTTDAAEDLKLKQPQRREVLLSAADLVDDAMKSLSISDTDSGRAYTAYFMNEERTEVSPLDFEPWNISYAPAPNATDPLTRWEWHKGPKVLKQKGKKWFYYDPSDPADVSKIVRMWFPDQMYNDETVFKFSF